jgi:Mg/Co/Ni transporter MgtE
MDWFANGLPREGARAGERRAADLARRNPPTCRLHDRPHDVTQRVRAAGRNMCVVVDDANVVLGVLDDPALNGDRPPLVEEAMRPAPSTLRPHLTLDQVAEHLKRHDREQVLITSADGELIGVLFRKDVEQRSAE